MALFDTHPPLTLCASCRSRRALKSRATVRSPLGAYVWAIDGVSRCTWLVGVGWSG